MIRMTVEALVIRTNEYEGGITAKYARFATSHFSHRLRRL